MKASKSGNKTPRGPGPKAANATQATRTSRKKRTDTSFDRQLDPFTESYIKTAIWADRPDHSEACEIEPGSLAKMIEDCSRFQTENGLLLKGAYRCGSHHPYYNGRYDATDAGHDFWLSRQGHGTGFDDRELGHIGSALQEASEFYGHLDVLPDDNDRFLFVE